MKASDHIRITAEAIRQFVKYSQSAVVPFLLQYSGLIQKGSEDADISPIYTRATNWHFYNRNLDRDILQEPIWSFMEPLTFHLSSDHILKKRCEQLVDEIEKNSSKDACNLTGRILHHIQDMSCPSHVVPVYHGPLIADSFESYLSDVFLSDSKNISDIAEELEQDAKSLAVSPDIDILGLYQNSAEITLKFLQPENSTCQVKRNGKGIELPWNYFWADKNTKYLNGYPSACKFGGFGTFGPLGKNFGTTEEFSIGDDTYVIEKEVYDAFCHQLVKDMLKNSIKALFLIENDLKKLC